MRMITKWTPLLLLASLLTFCSAVEERVVSSLFQSYITAQEALASDDFTQARQAFSSLANESDGDVRELALKAAEAEDIDRARFEFKFLSAKVEQLEIPEGYMVAYCPMADEGKGATWVQKDGEISNPYFGAKMLRCGVKKEQAPAS